MKLETTLDSTFKIRRKIEICNELLNVDQEVKLTVYGIKLN